MSIMSEYYTAILENVFIQGSFYFCISGLK